MSRRNNQNNQYNGNQYNGNQYYGNGQYYNGNNNQYYNKNGQYNSNMQYNQNDQYNQNGQYYNQNMQYNQQQQKPGKFGLYNQPYQTNKEKEKKKIDKNLLIKIGLFVGGAIILLLIVLAINSCGRKKECSTDFRKVGNQSYGYVCIPSDWVSFEEDPPNRSLQYSNVDGTYIFTMVALPTTQVNAKD